MTNYEIAKKLFDISRGLNKVWEERAIDADQDYMDTTMAIQGARDRISELATELAKDEAVEQEINLAKDRKAENLEDDVNSTLNN